jgi:TPR repeat protein
VKQRSVLVLVAIAVLAVAAPGVAQEADPGAVCDRLTADPADAMATGDRVALAAIDFAAAVPACEAAVAGAPGNPTYVHQLGRAFLAAGNHAAALERFMAAADAGYAAAAVAAGAMLHEGTGVQADIGEAVRLFRLALDAGNPDAALELGFIALHGEAPGMTLEDARDYFRGVFAVEEAGFDLQIDAIYGLAWALLGLHEDLEGVFTMADDALAALTLGTDAPKRALFLDILAEAETRVGRLEVAVADLAEAAQLVPDQPYYLDRLGDAFLAINLPTQAVGAWNRALALIAANPGAGPVGWDPTLIAAKIAAATNR